MVTLLGIAPLSEEELEQVVRKCSFDYMQQHHEAFEMHPPQLLAADAAFFVRGSADRFRDVPEATRQRIAAWCAERLRGSNFPLARYYPDVKIS